MNLIVLLSLLYPVWILQQLNRQKKRFAYHEERVSDFAHPSVILMES
ncbi:hypothetical protein [Bacillus smithii]